ncbi:MAG TPA: Ig-like domain-containing protein [Anaerolineae bacterium]|nr:Ig-like domain-containing protein [Anaerolineae bacterium]
MKYITLALLAFLMLIAACQSPTPAAPTPIPAAPSQIQTAVAQTLTAVAPTSSAGTPIAPPTQTQVAPATATAAPNQPTPTPGGETNPPTIQLLSPAQGAQISVNQTIQLVALAADDVGIARVEFFADNVLIDAQAPQNNPTTYQAIFSWSSTQVGQHTLFAIAYDPSNNVSAPATVAVNVIASNTPPQVSILAPPSPQNVNLGAQLTVQTVASGQVGVTQLQMIVDNQPYSQTNSQNPGGQTPFSANFIYAANAVGTHTIVIRATDSSGNVGNSNPLTVNVGDNTPPSVNTNYSAYNILQNQQVIVYTNATDAAGIQRVELWADNAIYNVYNSPNPPAQKSIAIQQVWVSSTPGNHVLFVRVYDVNNQNTTTPATNIFVRQPSQPTPTWTPFVPPPTPRPTRTPRPVTPPPNCQVQSPNTNFRVRLPNPISIQWNCTAQGGIRDMQVYYQYSGTMATIITTVPGDGGQQQNGSVDWTAPAPGVLTIFIQATDNLGQRGQSPEIPGVVENERPPTIPPPPTERPERPNIEGNWRGDVDNGFFALNLVPLIGCSETSCAWGGTWEDHRNGENIHGDLSGQLSGNRLTLNVDGGQPGDVRWTFEGQVGEGGSEISGEWTESRADIPSIQRGSVTFVR